MTDDRRRPVRRTHRDRHERSPRRERHLRSVPKRGRGDGQRPTPPPDEQRGGNLGVRIVTALVLAPAVLALTLWAPPAWFAGGALALMMIALMEWSLLSFHPLLSYKLFFTLKKKTTRKGKVRDKYTLSHWLVTTTPGLSQVYTLPSVFLLYWHPQYLPPVCVAGALYWSWHAFILVRDARRPLTIDLRPLIYSLSNMLQGSLLLFFACCGLMMIRLETGAAMTAAFLVVVWSADTCAFFAGRGFGKRPLAPAFSPKKTVEGLIGGVAGAGVVAFIAAEVLMLDGDTTVRWMQAALAAAVFSAVGDLFESRLKRRAEVKDSGAMLPGHGGVLDRIDGLLAAAPVFAAVWYLLG